MAEKFQAKTLEKSSQNSKDKQESIGYNESKKELQIKEAYYQVIKELKTSMKDDVDNLQKIVKSLRERESTFSNFVSPENFLGLSTLIRSDDKTFSGDRLDEIESMLEKMKLRQIGMIKLERMIENGIKLVDIKKDSNVKLFLESPEGVFLNGIIFDQTNPQILEGEYYIAKARELKSNITRGDELAQEWYDRAKGTPLDRVAISEKMSFGNRTLRKGREFANTMLGLDSLATMVLGIGIGRYAGILVSNCEKYRNISLITTTAINESKIAKTVLPGVNVLRSSVQDGKLASLGKGGLNFLAEIAKGFTYTEIARAIGGEKMAHAVSYPLMFIPGCKGQFEASLNVSLAKNPENFNKFIDWLKIKYPNKNILESAIISGFKEEYARKGIKLSGKDIDEFRSKTKNSIAVLYGNKTNTQNINHNLEPKNPRTGTKSSLAENTGTKQNETLQVNENPKGSNKIEIKQKSNPEILQNNPTKTTLQEEISSNKIENKVVNNPEIIPKKIQNIDELRSLVITEFKKHGILDSKNSEVFIMELIDKLKNYSKLQIKGKVDTQNINSNSLLDIQSIKPIDSRVLKKEIVGYIRGLETVGELMKGIDDWALMSSNSLMLTKKSYKYIPDDFDITIDVSDMNKALVNLKKLALEGKVLNIKRKAIVGNDIMYGKGGEVPETEIPRLIDEGNYKIVFDIKTKNGKIIETEFFIEDARKGFTQIKHIPRKIESIELRGNEIKFLSEQDTSEGYILNLLDEFRRNKVEGYSDNYLESVISRSEFQSPKTKDGTRILNILVYLEGVGIKKPSELITYAENIAAKYRGGPDEKMSEALRSTVDPKNLEMFKEEFGIILDKWKKFRPENIQQELPDFEIFRSRLLIEKLKIAKIYLNANKKNLDSKEKLDFLYELNIMEKNIDTEIQKLGKDNLSFCYFYELYKTKISFIKKTSNIINQ